MHMHAHSHPLPTNPSIRRRTLDLKTLDAINDEVHQLHEHGFEKAGQWDLSQMCQHLAAAFNGCIDGGVPKAALPVRLIARFFIKDAILRSRKIRSGVPAPGNLSDVKSCDEDIAINALAKAIDRFKAHQGELAPHPMFGKLTRDEWEQFHIIHAAHHLSYLVPG